MSTKYKKKIEKIVKLIQQHRLVEAEKKLIFLLQAILKTYPYKPINNKALVEYTVVQCLYQSFDEDFFPSNSDTITSPLFDLVHLFAEDSSWIDRKPKNYFLLACCRNPRLMDDILCQLLNFLLPQEPWYFDQNVLLQTLNDYCLYGWSSRLVSGTERHS